MNKDFERCCSFLADMIIKYAPEIKDEVEVCMMIKDSIDANYAQTECQFRYCGTAIPFLTVRSTAR